MSLTDPVARYILEAAPVHDLLRRGLIQLSGYLLKRTIAGQSGFVDCEPVDAARKRIVEAADIARTLWLTKEMIWDQLGESEKAMVLRWLLQASRATPPRRK